MYMHTLKMYVLQGILRQSKLSSMSKSDTRLHEMHRLPCNANGECKVCANLYVCQRQGCNVIKYF